MDETMDAKLQEFERRLHWLESWRDTHADVTALLLDKVANIEDKVSEAPGSTLPEWVFALGHGQGILLDAQVAQSSPCIALEVGPSTTLVYNRGVIGPLDSTQQAALCTSGLESRPLSPYQRTRLLDLTQASGACKQAIQSEPVADQLEHYFSCLARDLRARTLRG